MRTFFFVLLVIASDSVAQSPAIIDYSAPGGRALVGAQLAAGQLLSEVRLLSISAGGMSAQARERLQFACSRVSDQITVLYRSIQVGMTWNDIQPQVERINRGLTEIAQFVQQNAPNDQTLSQSIARVEFAWRRTEIKLVAAGGGFQPIIPGAPAPGQQQNYIATLARSLERQSDRLATVGQTTLPNNVWGETLETAIKDFARTSDRFRDHVERGLPFDRTLADLQDRWQALSRTLGAIQLHEYVPLRLQAARVNQLYVALLQAVGQPQVPAPVFPINNLKRQGVIAIGAGEGGVPVVRVYSDRQGGEHHDFMAYDPSFQGGVRVAVGDVNGDGVVDVVTAPGPGMPPLVRVFDGRDLSLLTQYYAYDQRFMSGVFVAAADITGNGRAEVVVGAGDPGGPHVRCLDGMTGQLKAEFYAYDQRLQCGARVALGDVDGDGIPDIVTAPGPGIQPIVKIFSGRNVAQISEFLAYEQAFVGGLFVAAADVNRNGRAEVVTGAGTNGGPHVRIFDPIRQQLVQEFYAYDRNFVGGVRVAVCDVVGDRRPDIITAPGAGISPIVRVYRNRDGQLDREFSAFDPNFTGGAWVAGN